MLRPKPEAGYQLDIKAFCTPDIMSCHTLFSIFVICLIHGFDPRRTDPIYISKTEHYKW